MTSTLWGRARRAGAVVVALSLLGCAAADDPTQAPPIDTAPAPSGTGPVPASSPSPTAAVGSPSVPVDGPSGSPGDPGSPPPTESAVPTAPTTASPTVPPAIGDAPEIALKLVAEGLSAPVYVTHAGGERLWVVEQPGRIRIIDDGRARERLFLDLQDSVACCREQGMLGLAFHPAYDTNGRLFVTYSDLRGDLVLSEFAGDAERAEPASERVVLRIPHRDYDDHYGGMLDFGRDGYLYFSTGDGGGISDPGRNAQDLDSALMWTMCQRARCMASRPITPSWAARGAPRSGRTASATRGASASTR